MYMSDFAQNLRKYRKQRKYSQMELAKELNYGYTAIANYESGLFCRLLTTYQSI